MRMGAKSWSRNTNAGAPFPGSITKAASGVCLNEFGDIGKKVCPFIHSFASSQ